MEPLLPTAAHQLVLAFLVHLQESKQLLSFTEVPPEQLKRLEYTQRPAFRIYPELKAIAYMWKQCLQCLIVMKGITMAFRLLPYNL